MCLILHFHFAKSTLNQLILAQPLLFVPVVSKMPRKRKTNQLRTTTADDDNKASLDHTLVDGEADSEDTSHQADGANILAAIHSMRRFLYSVT